MPVPVGSLLCRDRMKWGDGVALKRGEGSGAVDPASRVISRTSGGASATRYSRCRAGSRRSFDMRSYGFTVLRKALYR